MKKKIISLILVFALSLSLGTAAFAETKTWNYSNYDYGTYVPKSGTFSNYLGYGSGKGETMTTTCEFTLDATNVSSISDYNRGDGSHPNASGENCYLTLDVSCVRDGGVLDPFDAYLITTNLPNPKTDLESDNHIIGDGRREESEVVALGMVTSGTEYYMSTYWDDYRTGDSSGRFEAQFSMSAKGVSDYNNVIQSSAVQAIINFGGNAGEFRAAQPEALSNDNNSRIPATITFSSKLDADALESFCNEYDIIIEQVQGRGIDQYGDRVTVASLVSKGIDQTQAIIQELLENDGVNYCGFISIYAYVTESSISEIENDELTYSIETVMAQTTTSISENSIGFEFPHSRAWEMEDSFIVV